MSPVCKKSFEAFVVCIWSPFISAWQILNGHYNAGKPKFVRAFGSVKSSCVIQNSQFYMRAEGLQIAFPSSSFGGLWQNTPSQAGRARFQHVWKEGVSSGWGLGTWLRWVLVPTWGTVSRKCCQSQRHSPPPIMPPSRALVPGGDRGCPTALA